MLRLCDPLCAHVQGGSERLREGDKADAEGGRVAFHSEPQEIRYMTKRMRDKDEEEVVINDWKFAAMVIDRWPPAGGVKLLPGFACLA